MDHIEDFMSYRYYCKMYIVQKNTHKKERNNMHCNIGYRNYLFWNNMWFYALWDTLLSWNLQYCFLKN